MSQTLRNAFVVATTLALTCLAAQADETTSTTQTTSTSTSASTAGPSDADIAHIVVTADKIDIDAGKMAKSHSKNKSVKDFAQRMITDHEGVNKQATDLVKKLGVTPTDNDTSKSLMSGAKENMDHLKTLKGKDFDKAYVDHEVVYHQAVLDAIDKTLIPSAKNADLKALVVKVRPAIAAHLEHAQKIQTELAK